MRFAIAFVSLIVQIVITLHREINKENAHRPSLLMRGENRPFLAQNGLAPRRTTTLAPGVAACCSGAPPWGEDWRRPRPGMAGVVAVPLFPFCSHFFCGT
jgi:hypothetical protein